MQIKLCFQGFKCVNKKKDLEFQNRVQISIKISHCLSLIWSTIAIWGFGGDW
jgi:hypothetical protein